MHNYVSWETVSWWVYIFAIVLWTIFCLFAVIAIKGWLWFYAPRSCSSDARHLSGFRFHYHLEWYLQQVKVWGSNPNYEVCNLLFVPFHTTRPLYPYNKSLSSISWIGIRKLLKTVSQTSTMNILCMLAQSKHLPLWTSWKHWRKRYRAHWKIGIVEQNNGPQYKRVPSND